MELLAKVGDAAVGISASSAAHASEEHGTLGYNPASQTHNLTRRHSSATTFQGDKNWTVPSMISNFQTNIFCN